MGRTSPELLCPGHEIGATFFDALCRSLKDLLHDQMHGTSSQRPMLSSDWKEEGSVLTGRWEGRQSVFSTVPGQFDHQLIGGRHNPSLISLTRDLEPPTLLTVLVATAEESTIVFCVTSEIRRPPIYSNENSHRTRK